MNAPHSWQQIIDSFSEPAGIVDAGQTLVAANSAFLSVFGLSRQQMLQWSYEAFVASLKADARSMLLVRGSATWRVTERRIEGDSGHMLLSLRPVVDGRDALLQTGAAMAEVMVHRLRSPLTGVRGFLEMIQESPEGAFHQMELNAMANGLAEVSNILDLLYDLAVPNPPSLTQVNYRHILNTVLERFNVFDRRRIFIRSEANRFFWIADPNYLSRIFYELLKNGLEHNREEPAQVHVLLRNRGFDVANAGPAITEDVRNRLFTPFFTTKARGLGLGLAVSRMYAKKMQAEINLTSNASVTGIVFTCEFQENQTLS
jgi:signal transduction histidine kinase